MATCHELVFDPATSEGNSSFNIVQRVFSFVSGKIAASGAEQMTVSTPVVTIGIRGTQVAGVAAAEGEENTVTLLPDANGVVGELSITNGAGVSFVLNQPNQSIQATSFNAPISEPVILTDAQVNTLFGAALAVLPPPAAAADAAAGEAAGEGEGEAEEEEGEGEGEEGEGEEAEAEAEGEGEGEAAEEEAAAEDRGRRRGRRRRRGGSWR